MSTVEIVTDPTERLGDRAFDPQTGDTRADAAATTHDRSGPPPYLSPSSASTFDQCRRRWKFRYVDRLPDPPGEKALIGTFVHRVLEELLAAAPGERSADAARLIARAVWPEIEHHQAYIDLGLTADEGRRVRWDAWRLVEAYFELERPDTVAVVQREQRLEVELGGVPFVGVVDLVETRDNALVVTDYKTGRAPSARYEAGRLHQVQLYAAALAATGTVPDRARLLYLSSRSVETDVTTESIDAAVGALSSTWNAVNIALEVDEFGPTTGPLCAWCPYASECPEGRVEIERRYGPAA